MTTLRRQRASDRTLRDGSKSPGSLGLGRVRGLASISKMLLRVRKAILRPKEIGDVAGSGAV